MTRKTHERQQARQTQCTGLGKLHLKPFQAGLNVQTQRLAARLHVGSVQTPLEGEEIKKEIL